MYKMYDYSKQLFLHAFIDGWLTALGAQRECETVQYSLMYLSSTSP